MDDFVFGHALRVGEARAAGRADREVTAAYLAFAKRQIASGELPETAALFRSANALHTTEQIAAFLGDDRRFERGLEALLDGAERSLRAARASAAKRKRTKTRAR